MSFIAQRLNFFDSSPFREAVQKQLSMPDMVDLSIGVPEELTAEHIKAAGIRAIQNDKTTYTPANGLPELRAAVAQKLSIENGVICNQDQVTIVPGLTTGQLLVYLAVIDPGDEVIVFDPYYPPYPHLASTVGGHVMYVSTLPNFQLNLPALEASITNRTKLIVVNTPNNPTGAVYPESDLRRIAHIAAQHNLLVISDEIYEHFVYEGSHFSIGSIYPNTITMNGFSKEHAMTGWRVGYITAPQEIIDAINELQQYIVMSSSSIGQHAALAALEHHPEMIERYVDKYRHKRDYVIKRLKDMGFVVHGLQGAFYAFVQAPRGLTDIEFVQLASKHGLIIVPGRAFSSLHGYVRISYGASMPLLEKGLNILEQITKNSI